MAENNQTSQPETPAELQRSLTTDLVTTAVAAVGTGVGIGAVVVDHLKNQPPKEEPPKEEIILPGAARLAASAASRARSSSGDHNRWTFTLPHSSISTISRRSRSPHCFRTSTARKSDCDSMRRPCTTIICTWRASAAFRSSTDFRSCTGRACSADAVGSAGVGRFGDDGHMAGAAVCSLEAAGSGAVGSAELVSSSGGVGWPVPPSTTPPPH
jgi:hypothetical protein